MATKVHMEALSPTMEEGQLVKWLKHEGDAVNEGDILAEIETDKATMELVARGSGVLQNISIKEGETAPVGQQIALIAAEGEAAAPAAAKPADAAPADAAPAAAPAAAAVASTGETEKPQAEQKGATPAAEGTGSTASAPAAAPAPAAATSAQNDGSDSDAGRVRVSPLARTSPQKPALSSVVLKERVRAVASPRKTSSRQ